MYNILFIVYVLIINVVSCPPGTLIWKIKYLVSCIPRRVPVDLDAESYLLGNDHLT